MRFIKWANVLPLYALVPIMGAGAWARWRFMQTGVFQVDEFISMLAIRMILEKGQPVLPSGLYYDHGLLFTYIGAGVAYLADGSLLAARWWSLFIGVLTIALAYIVCWQLFGARWWGLAAALAVAWFPDAVEWGGRVRMYSQANFLLFTWVLFAWWGTLGGNHRWARWALIVVIWLGLITHFVLILAVLPLAFSLLLAWLLASNWKLQLWDRGWRVALEVGVALLVVAVSLWLARGSFIAGYAVESSDLSSDLAAANDGLVNELINIGPNVARWGQLREYFSKDSVFSLSVLAVLGAVIAVIRSARGLNKASLAGLFTAIWLVSVLAEMLLFQSDEWGSARYNFLVFFPLMPLLAVYVLQSISSSVALHFEGSRSWVEYPILGGLVALGFVWPLAGSWNETLDLTNGTAIAPYRYDVAFEYVDAERLPGDQLLTIHPAAGYLFSERLDYYANQTTPVIMPGINGWVDRYAGVPYLADVEDLNQALDMPGILWFVVDSKRLFERFEPDFSQQVLQRMALSISFDNVLVFREVKDAWPLAETPEQRVTANFGGNVRLYGYALSEMTPVAPGATVFLSLFWQFDTWLPTYKIFVHLRDDAGNTVAQADFIPLEGLEGELRNELIQQAQGEYVRLGTVLSIPHGLPSGGYTLWTGLYETRTLQRLSVINDTSGENAVLIGELINQ